MSKESNSSGSIGIGGALTLLFVALKLTGYINWSWWWIISPIWIPVSVIAILGIFYLLVKK
jgi:hypothetical protein